MIKRNIKMVVTPKQSQQVQEICFANGIGWPGKDFTPILLDKEYLMIRNGITWDDKKRFCELNLEEVEASFFIKTQGTCVETKPLEKPKQYLCYVSGKSLPKHIHKTLEQAKQEAQRLCRKELAKVSVLEVVAEYEAEVFIKEI